MIKAGIIKEHNPKQNFNEAIAKMKTDAELNTIKSIEGMKKDKKKRIQKRHERE